MHWDNQTKPMLTAANIHYELADKAIRIRIWSRQPKEFFEVATIDADGVLAATTGECKESYSGRLPFSLPVPRPPSAAGTPILSAILTV